MAANSTVFSARPASPSETHSGISQTLFSVVFALPVILYGSTVKVAASPTFSP